MGVSHIQVEKLEKTINAENGIKFVSQVLNINHKKDGIICTYFLNYKMNTNLGIDFPLFDISADIMMHSDEGYEVTGSTMFGDIDGDEILLQANLNVYKKPHKGWNYRLEKAISFMIFRDGGADYVCT